MIDPRELGEQPDSPITRTVETVQQATVKHRGMTKRQRFAGLAMHGRLSAGFVDSPEQLANLSVRCSDALLAELARERP